MTTKPSSQILGPISPQLKAALEDAARAANCSIDPEALYRLAVAMTPSQQGGCLTAEAMMRLVNEVLANPQAIARLNAVAIALRARD